MNINCIFKQKHISGKDLEALMIMNHIRRHIR